MNSAKLRNDILAVLQARNIRLYRLARESGVDSASLWKFVHNPKANLNTDSLFKLWPHIYGEQSPTLLPVCGGQKRATESHPVTVGE